MIPEEVSEYYKYLITDVERITHILNLHEKGDKSLTEQQRHSLGRMKSIHYEKIERMRKAHPNIGEE